MSYDFNTEASLGTNRAHILDLIVLSRRDEWLNTYQQYKVSVYNNNADKNELFFRLRGILETIEFELRETLKRQLKKEPSYNDFKTDLLSADSEQKLLSCFDTVNNVLDTLQITKIDNRKRVDSTDIEATNESKGL